MRLNPEMESPLDSREGPCIQERFAPENHCFGCGPANPQGLRLRSFAAVDASGPHWVCDWQPQKHHEAFTNVLNGGIIGTLLDCHSNWAAACHLMARDQLEHPPPTVTIDFHVKLKRPTPSDRPVHLVARAVSDEGDRVKVEATLQSGEQVTATCVGTFTAVKPGHPAFHRW